MSAEEVKALTKNYHDLQHDVNSLRQSVSNVEKSLQRIELGLFGDEDLSHVGVIKQLHDYKLIVNGIKQTVEDVRIAKEKEDAKIKVHKWWITGIASSIGGAIVWVLGHLKDIFN